ncbi:MAG: DNA-binding protein WhiA [Clostridiales bacterium]|nr:DNA-binding protein WhiA [Clostridiales bacterium]
MTRNPYSQDIKEQICKITYKKEDEWAAEMAAICLCTGYDCDREKDLAKVMCTSEEVAARLILDCTRSGTGMKAEGPNKVGRRGGSVYEVLFPSADFESFITDYLLPDVISEKISSSEPLRRAMLRGAFLARGSMSDPNRTYRIEILCRTDAFVKMLILLFHSENISPMTRVLDVTWSIYFKKHDEICDFLVILGAVSQVLELQNIRAQHDVNSMVARSVILDTWTVKQQSEASARRTKDLERLLNSDKAARIPRELLEVARVHIDNPGLSLTELGRLMDPPLTKSGMNHRLKKLLDYL